MALILHLKSIDNLKGKGSRFVKVKFRGTTLQSNILPQSDDCAIFNETFDWPIARGLEAEETIEVDLYSFNKYRANKLIGSFQMFLQEIIHAGNISIADFILDSQSSVTQSVICFDLNYHSPDGTVGNWQIDSLDASTRYDEASPKHGKFKPDFDLLHGIDMDFSFVDTLGLSDVYASEDGSVTSDPAGSSKKPKPIPENSMYKEQNFQVNIMVHEAKQLTGLDMNPMVCLEVGSQRKFTTTKNSTNNPSFEEFFVFDLCMPPVYVMDQVLSVTVIHSSILSKGGQAGNYVGTMLNMGSIVGSFKMDLGVVYANNEHQFYRKWAQLIDPKDINGGPKGYLLLDIQVITRGCAAQYQYDCPSWLVLAAKESLEPVDPDYTHLLGGYQHIINNKEEPLGPDYTHLLGGYQYTVNKKPEPVKDEHNIDENLLLPKEMPAKRQRAAYSVRIYKAEGLPKMKAGLMVNVKKALTGDEKPSVNPYVQVSFGGQTGRTSTKYKTYEPAWNEQIVFTDLFPTLCRRVKIQLRDNDTVIDSVIGTYFIDMYQISDKEEKGFLPTFGPCWINLYGSPRGYKLTDDLNDLNEGLGEGVAYRGRILLSVKVDILDTSETGPQQVDREAALPISANAAGLKTEFFMYATFLNASMIPAKYQDKPIYFEISLGNWGNTIDGVNVYQYSVGGDNEEDEQKKEEPDQSCSTTPPVNPVPDANQYYYHMPFYEKKPSVYVRAKVEDHRRRMYNENHLEKVAEKLEFGLNKVRETMRQDEPFEKVINAVVGSLSRQSSKYCSTIKGIAKKPAAGKTKLDTERLKLCERTLNEISNDGSGSIGLGFSVFKDKPVSLLKKGNDNLKKIRQLAEEPQDALPDVFVWMICDGKRVAYQRIKARDLMHSTLVEECGNLCGKVQTLFLRLPGKKGKGSNGWAIQAMVEVYMWLGLAKNRKSCLSGLPPGYKQTHATRKLGKDDIYPTEIEYTTKHHFQLRAHIFQGRGLIGSDLSGLSDPFTHVVFGPASGSSQVLHETVSPTWDETIVLKGVTLYRDLSGVKETPPIVLIELYDEDKLGKPEFIGRALAYPVVKGLMDPYMEPDFPAKLDWWDIYRGPLKGGELLAAFELFEVPEDGSIPTDFPPMGKADVKKIRSKKDLVLSKMMREKDHKKINFKVEEITIYRLPYSIRPRLGKYRLEILFWGVRDLKRVQLLSVEKPRIDIEMGGHIVQSCVISEASKNPNFPEMVNYIDLDLPEEDLFCPPITIRCVDRRSFGRFVLVGTHTISAVHKLRLIPEKEKPAILDTSETASLASQLIGNGPPVENGSGPVQPATDSGVVQNGTTTTEEQSPTQQQEQKQTQTQETQQQQASDVSKTGSAIMDGKDGDTKVLIPKDKDKDDDVAIDIDEKKPLIPKEGEEQKTVELPSEEEENALDWWSRYYVSMETMYKNEQHENELKAKCLAEDHSHEQHHDHDHTHVVDETKKPSDIVETVAPTVVAKKAKKLMKFSKLRSKLKGVTNKGFEDDEEPVEENDNEWKKNIVQFTVLTHGLEAHFGGFDKDWLQAFTLYRGKRYGDEEDEDDERIAGQFKGAIRLYKLTDIPAIERNLPLKQFDKIMGTFQSVPKNDLIGVWVRVYVIKATDLHPADITGKADPYLNIKLGKTSINEKDNRINKCLNPVFGKCFSFDATFPLESLLTVQVYDYDMLTMDDLIGETKIDLEDRYYSKHRATCGIATKYEIHGYNTWRDTQTPSEILSSLCKTRRMPLPKYDLVNGRVKIRKKSYEAPVELIDEGGVIVKTNEHLALEVLKNWHEVTDDACKLVPEHLEIRPLYHPDKPFVEQGKLHMWVDLFPMTLPQPPAPVDVTPRKPKSYELRAIIWNTEDVVLNDTAVVTGEKMSDIYVKGWLTGHDDQQTTDVHYRSLTGEGNFNWRFIYKFDYLVAEEKIVIMGKESIFDIDETEIKLTPNLELQAWDADFVSMDDCLGAITLNLTRMVRGAKSHKKCSLDMLKCDGSVRMMNLFKTKRMRGWWPLAVKEKNSEEFELTGKLELELQLLTAEEAEKNPAGYGRHEPEPLPFPNRPDTSFMWFLNPWKSLKYILWANFKYKLLKFFIFLLVVFFIGVFFYSMPGYTVKKMWGA